MNRFNRFITKYLLFSFPAVLAVLIWGTCQDQQEIIKFNNMLIKVLWEILSFHFILWMMVLIYSIFLLIFSSDFRERIIVKLVRIKERDERERHIIGRASRFTFVSTLALLVLFLFISTVNISVIRLPEKYAVDGKKNAVSIGFSLDLFDAGIVRRELAGGEVIFSTEFLPLSKQTILLILIIGHLGTFYLTRKEIISTSEKQ